MTAPADRTYLQTHEWHKLEEGLVVIGVSQPAVDELTDITYLEVAKASGPIEAGESFGEIESVKATSELYCGVAGEVVEVNQAVLDEPGIINEDCYGRGWVLKVRPADPAAVEGLLTAEAYQAEHAGS